MCPLKDTLFRLFDIFYGEEVVCLLLEINMRLFELSEVIL